MTISGASIRDESVLEPPGGPQVCFYMFDGCVVLWAKLAAIPAKRRHRGLSALTVANSVGEVGVQRPTQVGEGRQAHRVQKMARELVVKKQNLQKRSEQLWFPELSFLLEVKGGSTAYNPKALNLAHRSVGVGGGGQQNGLAHKGACCQAGWSEFDPSRPTGWKKRTSDYCQLSYPHTCVHTQDDKINILKQ